MPRLFFARSFPYSFWLLDERARVTHNGPQGAVRRQGFLPIAAHFSLHSGPKRAAFRRRHGFLRRVLEKPLARPSWLHGNGDDWADCAKWIVFRANDCSEFHGCLIVISGPTVHQCVGGSLQLLCCGRTIFERAAIGIRRVITRITLPSTTPMASLL